MSTKQTNISPEEARRRLDELDPLFELAYKYAQVKRANRHLDGARETDAEHALSLAFVGLAYLLKYHPEVDPYKALFYFIFHDIDEFLEGDTPTLGATDESYAVKDAAEARARIEIHKTLKPFPELRRLFDEMNDLTIPANAAGKGLDKVAPGYTHRNDAGHTLKEDFGIHSYEDLIAACAVTDKKMAVYCADFPDIIEMRKASHKRVSEASF